MNGFLAKSAHTILQNHKPEDLKNICVVLPSRRATYFFKKEMSDLATQPIISPYVFAIDDFICQTSGLQIADQITLLFDLFKVFKEDDSELVFEEFIKWGPTILKDFDLIDQYLIENEDALFTYMSEIEAMNRWSPEQENSIKMGESSKAYFEFFETLKEVFKKYKQQIGQKDYAYRGMAYREVAENMTVLDQIELPYSYFYFVGLNALSRAESSILKRLVEAKKATCLWDTDQWFMDSKHQAGQVLRRYRNSGDFGVWNKPENLLASTSKEINVYEFGSNVLQAKFGAGRFAGESTVYVVPDESLLQPILFSMPPELEEYNITMGLGIAQSKLAALIKDLFEIQLQQKDNQVKYHFQDVKKIVSNPLSLLYSEYAVEDVKPFDSLKETLKRGNRLFLKPLEIYHTDSDNSILELYFAPWFNDTEKAIQRIKRIVNLLQITIFDALDQMEREFFNMFSSILNRLEDEYAANKNLSIEGIQALLKELFKTERVPFTGEPIAPLQIMSLLETRCLDFEHVVFFATNEGVLPSSTKNTSMIPYEVCKYFDIPVFSDQDDIMSYHFYRLLMRAKKVDILYVKDANSGLGGQQEPSRFIPQLKHLLCSDNAHIVFKEHRISIENKGKLHAQNMDEIHKTPEVLSKVKEWLQNESFSATTFNAYVSCSLKFYYSKILKISLEDNQHIALAANEYGTWLHNTLDFIAKEVIRYNTLVTTEVLKHILARLKSVISSEFEKELGKFDKATGINYLYEKLIFDTLERYFKSYYQDEKTHRLLASELRINCKVPVTHPELTHINLKGSIDAIEEINGVVRVIDYKTGDIKIKSKFETEYDMTSADKFEAQTNQLLLYLYMMRQAEQSANIRGLSSEMEAGIYSFKMQTFKSLQVADEQQVKEKVESGFENLVNELLDVEKPFKKTENITNCQYCDFAQSCERFTD